MPKDDNHLPSVSDHGSANGHGRYDNNRHAEGYRRHDDDLRTGLNLLDDSHRRLDDNLRYDDMRQADGRCFDAGPTRWELEVHRVFQTSIFTGRA